MNTAPGPTDMGRPLFPTRPYPFLDTTVWSENRRRRLRTPSDPFVYSSSPYRQEEGSSWALNLGMTGVPAHTVIA